MLLAKHGIDHITLQPETAAMAGLHQGDKTH
jgi:cobalt-zinc-cadmium efflux system protein